jgi:hypothetical protein
MFIVLASFDILRAMGKPLAAVPTLFLVLIFASTMLGEVVARAFSEPLNGLLRGARRDGRHAGRYSASVERAT